MEGEVPKGRLKKKSFSHPFGTHAIRNRVPNAEALGYCQMSLSPRWRAVGAGRDNNGSLGTGQKSI